MDCSPGLRLVELTLQRLLRAFAIEEVMTLTGHVESTGIAPVAEFNGDKIGFLLTKAWKDGDTWRKTTGFPQRQK